MGTMHFVTMDLETTDTNICKAQPIQIAALVAKVDLQAKTWELVKEEVFYVKLESMQQRISEGALKAHGITEDVLTDQGIECWQVAKWWKELGFLKPTMLVGYNIILFDLPMMINFIERTTPRERFKHPSFVGVSDVMHRMSTTYFGGKWPKLRDSAIKAGVIPPDETKFHDAMFDVKMSWEVFCWLQRYEKRNKGGKI